MIKEVVNYIAANTTLTLNTDLFAIAVDPKSDVDECIIVAEPSPGLVDGLLADKRQIPLVAYSRAKTRFTARDNAYTVFNLFTWGASDKFHGNTQISLTAIGSGPVYVCNFVCNIPYYVGLDESGKRFVYSMPVGVTVTNMI